MTLKNRLYTVNSVQVNNNQMFLFSFLVSVNITGGLLHFLGSIVNINILLLEIGTLHLIISRYFKDRVWKETSFKGDFFSRSGLGHTRVRGSCK